VDEATLARHRDEIAGQGYTVLPDVFDAGAAAAIEADLHRIEAELAQAPSADGVQHHVGHHRLHRGQRRHPGDSRLAPGRPLPHLQRLVGYSVYRGLIGHIDKHDPIELLARDDPEGHAMVWDRR